jgi:hypothetical protein
METQFDEGAAAAATAVSLAMMEAESAVVKQEQNVAAESIFDGMSCQKMLETFSELLKNKPIQELRTAMEQLKTAFRSRRTAEHSNAADSVVPADNLETKLKDLIVGYRKKYADYTKKNLCEKQELLAEFKELLEEQNDSKAKFTKFKTMQQQWQNIGAVPTEQYNDIQQSYKHIMEKFYDMMKINRELQELNFKKNYELKSLLCEKAEALLLENNIAEAAKTLQKYHQQWHEIGPVAAEHKQTLWERFSGVSATINKKNAQHYEAQKQQRAANLCQKEDICAKIEACTKRAATIKQWKELTECVVELQQKWKAIGPVPAKDNDHIYQRFKTAVGIFFESRKNFYDKVTKEYDTNVQKKTALCEQAENIAQSSDWNSAANAIIQMQRQWKEIGAVPQKMSDELWQRFKKACNTFFERKKQHYSQHGSALENNLAAKKLLIEKMKACTPCPSEQENMAIIDKFQQQWMEIGAAPKSEAENIRHEYRKTLQELYKMLNIKEQQQHLHQFKQQIESDKDPQHVRIQRDNITRSIKRMEEEKMRIENNISFFKYDKNNKYLAEFSAKIDMLTSELVLAKEKLKILREQNI